MKFVVWYLFFYVRISFSLSLNRYNKHFRNIGPHNLIYKVCAWFSIESQAWTFNPLGRSNEFDSWCTIAMLHSLPRVLLVPMFCYPISIIIAHLYRSCRLFLAFSIIKEFIGFRPLVQITQMCSKHKIRSETTWECEYLLSSLACSRVFENVLYCWQFLNISISSYTKKGELLSIFKYRFLT